MIRVNDLVQGSAEWFEARRAILTGIGFTKVITPKGKPSSQQDDYMDKLVAEYTTEIVDETFKSDWMKRGNELEPEAADIFAYERDVIVEEVGIVYRDKDKLMSCSPDRFWFSGSNSQLKGLEIKCPKASTFVKYVREGILPDEYKAQVIGSMLVCGMTEWTFMAYHPSYKPFILDVKADPVFLRTLEVLSKSFIERMLIRRIDIQPFVKE